MGTLEQEFQKIHDAGIGVVITWLRDGGVDLRLVRKSGVVTAEGNVEAIADVVSWLETAIRKNFPAANYDHAARPRSGNLRSAMAAMKAGNGR
jgi:hypothetical protein